MKTHIKTVISAFLVFGAAFCSMGAGNGKEQLGKIKSNQFVVTQEVDAAFTTWTNSYRVQFPKATPGSIYIGTNSLSQLMPKLESDPTVPAWAKAPNAPKESDPKFREWVVKPTLSITNNGVRFKNATTSTILIGDKALGQYFLPKSYQESDPRFKFWYERPTLILTNEAVRLSANPTNFYIGGRAFPSYFEGYLKSYSETDPDFHRWLDVDTLTFNNRKVVMPSTFYIGTNTFLSYFDGFLREYHETDPKFNTWLGQDTLTFANRKVVVPETFYIGTNKFLSYFDGFLREYHETDPKFYNWLAYDTITFTNRKVAVSNGFHVANANSFYIEGRKFPSYFDGLLTEEKDPLFSKWTGTNTYVKVEEDPLFYGWLGGTTIEFINATPSTVKIGNTTVESLLDGKLDATNGVAYVDFKVYPMPSGTFGQSHTIITHESISIGDAVEYKENEITHNGESYEFGSDQNGIARLKDIKDETDPIFWALFGNPILNLITYDEINLVGSNRVTITSQNTDISGKVSINGSLEVGNKSSPLSATGTYSVAEGKGQAFGDYSHAEGADNISGRAEAASDERLLFPTAEGYGSHAEGTGYAKGDYSHAEGGGNDIMVFTNVGWEAHVVVPTAEGKYSHAEGTHTWAYGSGSHAEGDTTLAYGKRSHAEGEMNKASNNWAHVEGYQNIANGSASHVEGYLNVSQGEAAHIEGKKNNMYGKGEANHIEGATNVITTSSSASLQAHHAEGLYNTITATGGDGGNHIEGRKNEIVANGGKGSNHAEGRENHILTSNTVPYAAHVEGYQNFVYGPFGHAEGYGNIANAAEGAHVEGKSNKILGTGGANHMEGWANTISGSGDSSHVEGKANILYGSVAHAEGYQTVSASSYSHSEGEGTVAATKGSHTEGHGDKSTKSFKLFYAGTGSSYTSNIPHGLGVGTLIRIDNEVRKITSVPTVTNIVTDTKFNVTVSNSTVYTQSGVAYGVYAHSEGYNTVAVGEGSHAEGSWTKTANNYEHSQGRFNATHTSTASYPSGSNTIHSIGIGTSESNRRNAVEVMQNGNVYVNGVGGYNGTNPNATGVITLQAKIQSLEAASSGGIQNITTNGTAFSVSGGTVTIPLDNYVRIDELQKGIKFNNMSVTNLTINGRRPSLEGHTHTLSQIDDLSGLWSIPGAHDAATNAIAQIEVANDLPAVKTALIQFLNNFKKPNQ